MYEDLDLILSTEKRGGEGEEGEGGREGERENSGDFLAVLIIQNYDVIIASLLIKSCHTGIKPEQPQKGILSPVFIFHEMRSFHIFTAAMFSFSQNHMWKSLLTNDNTN